jgi:Virulence factor BrkB
MTSAAGATHAAIPKNTIWNVEEPKEAGVWWYLRTYLISFAGILGLGFLLAVSLVIGASLAALSSWSGTGATLIGEAVNFVVSLAILTALFGMLFKWFPDTEIAWSDVLPGAVATALLFNAGKYCHRLVHRHPGARIHVRRRRLDRCAARLGLLFGANRPVRCRTHPRVCGRRRLPPDDERQRIDAA